MHSDRESTELDAYIYVARYVDVTKIERHAEQLAALGHVARLSLLRAVVQAGPEGISTTDLQERLDIPWTTLNHHLDRLVDAGLVTVRREGKFAYHTADYPALRAVTDFLWEDCCKRGKGTAKGCC
jgi:ArsR family transcriptional regulator